MTTMRLSRPGTTNPFGDLARHGQRPALVAGGQSVTYADLAGRVRERAAHLGERRRLVQLECHNDVETVVTYLAALEGHHPVLLTGPSCPRDELAAAYRPEVVARGALLEERAQVAPAALHPDLAVLLSTSGSTGSPKLVRLSHENVRSNAASIATYLGLTAQERAATTLPLQYCYGLSVLNSHLLVGASVLLTDASVVEERFWREFAAAGATSFAGVPHTFDLLDSSGFADRELPTLRTVTQAGGRLAQDAVRRYARLGQERGFDFVVMYGQTEATARMAYLPAHLAADRPESIGIPVPGGNFRIDGEGEVGELVYTGPNVMLGYARTREDLALGRAVRELRTGDLARQHSDGLFEIVGRCSRFAKLFGLRIDLDRVEEMAAEAGSPARVVEQDGRLHTFVTRHHDTDVVAALVRRLGLPAHVVQTHVLAVLPHTPSGKPDRAALLQHLAAVQRDRTPGTRSQGPVSADRVRDLYAHLLGRPDATEDDSFVTLRGDSLSYVEASVRLGTLLPDLPEDWAQRSARQLAEAQRSRPRRRGWSPVETPVVLRALAIVLIVGSHANLMTVMGGAHVLLAVAGFNLARFQLAAVPRRERRRGLLNAARNVAVPSALWIGGVVLLTGMYDASTALMLNNVLGSDTWDVRWQFWFLEVVVWTLAGAAVVLPLAAVDRLERARPFAFAAAVVVAMLALRFLVVGVEAGPTERYALLGVLWCVALGWMAARAGTHRERLLTSCVAVVACWGYFGDPVREALVAGGVVLLVWVTRLLLPTVALPLVSTLAASSLFVYLTHWQVYPHLETDHPLLATVASFAVGIVAWRAYGETAPRVARLWRAGSLYSTHARLRGRWSDRRRARVVPQARAR
jgi:acyl-CoA synthetase (AMP-forming)/AMP-acid ligase II